MSNHLALPEDSQSIQAHLTLLQAVIQRMAGNSAACKTWCITLVSALLVLIADKGTPRFAWLALIPTILFCILDAYYLALEQTFRNAYNSFVTRLHTGQLSREDLFVIAPKGEIVPQFLRAIRSFSVYPFYAVLTGLILVAKTLVV
jgi:hypothetical protein